MSKLTKKQREILDFIIAYLRTNNYSPSYQDIADEFGLSSKATVFQHIQTLREKGFLTVDNSATRNVMPTDEAVAFKRAVQLPLTGLITAGEPIEAVATRETMAVPADLIRDAANTYVLQVRGESMIDEGILDGDFVIVERNPSPRNGDVVVALLQNEYATLKKFYRERDRIRLQPANATMQPIFARDPLIQGVVRAIIRKFQTI
ncbi:MAG TPA: transcriptional repressor LexA [Candidatus Saccharimonadales bacterium]